MRSLPTRAPTAAELELLRERLATLGVATRELEAGLRAADVKKHALLLREGDSADVAGVVLTGVVREYYVLPDGTERTRGFALPGDSFGSLSDALSHRPSRVVVRAESRSTVLLLSWSRVEQLVAASP